MKKKHNILVGGAKYMKWIYEHDEVKNNLYITFNDPEGNIRIKVKVEGLDDKLKLQLSIPEINDEQMKIIKNNNNQFEHDPNHIGDYDYWLTQFLPRRFIDPNSTNGLVKKGDPNFSKVNDKGSKLKYINTKFTKPNGISMSKNEQQKRILALLNGEETSNKKETKKKQTKKNTSKKTKKKQTKKNMPKNMPKKTKKKKKNEPKKDDELIEAMKTFLKDGVELKNKHNIDYNAWLKKIEKENRDYEELDNLDPEKILYPILEDTKNFNKRIYEKKEFKEGNEYPLRELPDSNDGNKREEKFIETTNNICNNIEFELLPHQKFIKNFLSFQTPYNSLLIYHGLGTGKTCSSIGVAEEFRTYANQMGINKKILIVASKLVQANYEKQLFDENKLKEVGGLWNIKSCTGNKFLKEINPMNMVNLDKNEVIKQVKAIIRDSYEFIAYLEFANQIKDIIDKVSTTDEKERIIELKKIYSDRLIIIDEVHNIRDVSDAPGEKKKYKGKSTTEHLKTLVTYADNLKLLLLTGTPMYNEYKEIIWLLNLMNLNDNRYTIEESDIFDNEGEFIKDKEGNKIGEELLIQKSTGYVSFVKGEDPYMFPFRVYPEHDPFSYKENSLNLKKSDKEKEFTYPQYQLNGVKIETL